MITFCKWLVFFIALITILNLSEEDFFLCLTTTSFFLGDIHYVMYYDLLPYIHFVNNILLGNMKKVLDIFI